MFKNIIIRILVLSFLFQSCSTALITMDGRSKLNTNNEYKSKTFTTRSYLLRNIRFNSETRMMKSELFESSLKNVMREVTSLNLVSKNPIPDVISFNQGNSKERAGKYLFEEIKPLSTDFFLEVYGREEIKYLHNYRLLMYGIWGVAHLITLGLIPIYIPLDLNQEGKLYNNNGELIKTSHATTEASYWRWSPFIFRKDSSKGFTKKLKKRMSKENTTKILNELLQ